MSVELEAILMHFETIFTCETRLFPGICHVLFENYEAWYMKAFHGISVAKAMLWKFESRRLNMGSGLAQWLASWSTDQGVPGLRPGRDTVCCGLEQVTFTHCLKVLAEAIRTTVVPIRILICTTVVPIMPLIGTTVVRIRILIDTTGIWDFLLSLIMLYLAL